ncbi:hypothetical protein RRF68_07660 [Tenacibaculum sp. HL-MS23]|uniref:hypothetical protein n=1 Tax=Tenacibaculum sp. HL-MS23 TaxID=3077734 RepID=UPI0028FC133B|nr:hypothetical protein [Tenacibaculum sp. HL-MS23]WNW00873.1 hypothetical protein RRF68_07660 [Tenacibaculum sp. HL-MS23]
MKKASLLKLFILVYALIFIACMISCEKHECKCEHEGDQTPEGTFCYIDEGRTKEMLNYTEIVAMLKSYDTTRIAPLEKALGYEDSRINNYNFIQFKKYLGRIENLSKKAKINITGISFIAAAKSNYSNTGKSYQDLIYIPTTTVNGKQIAFDPVQSAKQGKLVTFKEMLALNGYKWIYDTKDDFEAGKIKNYDYGLKTLNKNKESTLLGEDELSGVGNKGTLTPPFN